MTPDDYTNQEFFIDVGDGHQLYVHDWGDKDAKTPIIFLHGGPGNGCDDRDKQKFDPENHRVIFHDQRGSGKSLPTASLEDNTGPKLVDDIDKIVQRLKLDRVVLVGGSWGSTLSLLYGIAHPKRVAGMVLDGIFTSTQAEYDWFDGGWRQFFPEAWEQYQDSVPASYRDNPNAYHLKQIDSDDPETVKKAAYAFLRAELAILKLDSRYNPGPYDKFEPANGLIEMRYIANKCFLPDGYILKNAPKLTMPIWMVQGRYDMVCAPQAAYNLEKVLPEGHLVFTINGHARQHEAGNIQRLTIDRLTGVN